MSDIGDELGEGLRRLALRLAAMISRHPGDWKGAVGWLLRTLPCVETHYTHEPSQLPPSATRVLWLDPDVPNHSPIYLYVDEQKDSGDIGPIARKIRCAWTAATFRFDWRHHEKFYDFGIDDARRIALLAALTLCRDFDGADLGLITEHGPGWPWNEPDTDKWKLEGRHWTWSMTATLGNPGRELLQLMTLADEYLALKYVEHGRPDRGTSVEIGVVFNATVAPPNVEVHVPAAQPTINVVPPPPAPLSHVPQASFDDLEDGFVTLDQAGAVIGKKKRTMEEYLRTRKIPQPDFPGGEGKAHHWKWSTIRPSLEKITDRKLPERFPAGRIIVP